jgi:endo-1,4-beta-mannosidase
MIKDLGVKNIKIHTQWDWIEGEKGKFYFSDTDWQLQQANDNGVKIIYVVGMKSGRWPECHIPGWVNGLPEQQQKDETLNYIKEVVQRYKDNNAITYWQVENEPLFNFGKCPSWYYKDNSFLKQEVALVKSLDPSRKIIVSDTGEQSSWFGAAKVGDIVGITMYREAWAHISDSFGFYFHYFFSPVFYSRKALIIQKIFGKNVICIEFQAEPWASKLFNDIPLSEQYKTMNLQIFKDNVEYAKGTGFDTFYFWGAEWWYWLKADKNQPQIWDEAKKLFQS